MNENFKMWPTRLFGFVKMGINRIWNNKKWRYGSMVLIVVLLLFIFKKPDTNFLIDHVARVDLTKSVVASGVVTSVTDIDLGFNSTGVVKKINVKVGDKVVKGQIIASLGSGEIEAKLTSARGTLLSAEAKYKKLLEVNNNDLRLAQIDVDNAYRQMLSDGLVALPEDYTTTNSNPIITGIYNGDKTGRYYINHYRTISGFAFNLTSHKDDAIVSSGSGRGSTTKPTLLGNEGLYILYEEDWEDSPSTETYIVDIPNTKSASYVTNYNNYQTALQNLEIAKQNSNIENADIDQAKADILIAQGSLQEVQANYENLLIRAPVSGTITKIDVKYGELVNAQTPVVVVQDVGNLYVETKVNESDISKISLGLATEFMVDAYSDDLKFSGSVVEIDPSATKEDGISNYIVKSSINDLQCDDTAFCSSVFDLIKPGMNADVTFLIGKSIGVLVVPESYLIKKDGKVYINLNTNSKKKKFKEVEIQTGELGDGNLVEVLSGLKEGDEIAVFPK